jgi:hypothetical protein
VSNPHAEIYEALAAPFAKSELRSRPGRAGLTFTYADAAAVVRRFDEVLGGNWSFDIAPFEGGTCVKGTIFVRYPDGSVAQRSDIGYPNKVGQDEEPLKSAATDALRRAARLFGVGLYLYARDDASKKVADSAPAQRAAKPKPAGPKSQMRDMLDTMLAELKRLGHPSDLSGALAKHGVSSLDELPEEVIAEWAERAAAKVQPLLEADAELAERDLAK